MRAGSPFTFWRRSTRPRRSWNLPKPITSITSSSARGNIRCRARCSAAFRRRWRQRRSVPSRWCGRLVWLCRVYRRVQGASKTALFDHLVGPGDKGGDDLNRFTTRGRRRNADRGDVGLVGFHAAAFEHGRAGNEGVGAGGSELACDFRGNTAIDLDVDRTSGGHRAQVTDLAKGQGNKSLTAEAGVD